MSHTIKNFTFPDFPSSGVLLLLALREQSNVVGALGLCAVTTAPTSTRRVLSTSPRCSKTSRKPWSLGYSWFIIDIVKLVGDCKEISNGNGHKAQNYFPSDQPAWQLWREVQALGSGEFACYLSKCLFACGFLFKYMYKHRKIWHVCVLYNVSHFVKYLEIFVWQILTCIRWWNCSKGKAPRMPPSTTLLRCWQRL